MTTRSLSPVILIIIFIFLVSGCLPSINQGDPPAACSSASTHLEQLSIRDGLKGTMKALADIEIQTMGRRYPARMAVMARGPDTLRMEAIPLIGPPDFMLSIKGDRLRVFLPQKGEFYIGEASKHLSRFMPVPIDVRDVVSILMGTYPRLKEGDCIAPDVAEGDLRPMNVFSREGDLRMSLWIKSPEQTLIRLKTYGGNEKADYTVVFSDYGIINRIAMPEKILIRGGSVAGLRQTVTVRYSDLEFTNETDAQLFELPVPPGLLPIDLRNEDIKND